MGNSGSLEFHCYDTTREIIKSLARERVFVAVGSDNVKPVTDQSVIGRYNRRPKTDEKADGGERGVDLPGIIVTYLGSRFPVSSGENDIDGGTIEVLIQIVDEGDGNDDTNIKTYLNWMREIRLSCQDSALEDCPLSLGEVYLVHVSDARPTDETDWAFEENMRSALVVTCFTRTPRRQRR